MIGTTDPQVGSEISQQLHEVAPLLLSPSLDHWWTRICKRFRATSMCVTSKAALLTLLFSFSIGILYGLSSNPGRLFYPTLKVEFISLIYTLNAISLCFYPFAGYLADTVTSRYKIIIRSLQILVITVAVAALPMTTFTTLFGYTSFENSPNYDSHTKMFWAGLIGMLSLSVLFYIAMNVSFVGFNSNVIQFGMEQLHDSPTNHQSLYIYWHVWICYLVQIVIVQPWSFSFLDYKVIITLLVILAGGSFTTVVISLCVVNRNKTWFLINPARVNPYSLVGKVTRFAQRHQVPIRRSAFTYCEDEIPMGLDLAKSKYGGPYTTEEVENVKALFGIMKIILSLGPVFFFSYASDPAFFWYTEIGFAYVGNDYLDVWASLFFAKSNGILFKYHYFISSKIISSLAVVVLIPLYIFFVKPLRCCYPFNMLKRIGLGILFQILNLISITAFISSFEHLRINCMFQSWFRNSNFTDDVTIHALQTFLPYLSHLLYGIANMLLYTALYEFICAQSPSSMKGLLIGFSFAVKGIFQAIGAAFVIPFSYIPTGILSCGIWYYGTNSVLAIVALAIFTIVARKYKNRQRDEICDVYRYAEEYYSNKEQEQNYD